jgi:hypothetical protein
MKKTFFTALILASLSSVAQVKIGVNPAQIVSGAYLQINGTSTPLLSDPKTFIVNQDGDVSIGATAASGTLYLESSHQVRTSIGLYKSGGNLYFINSEGGTSGTNPSGPGSFDIWDYTQNKLRFIILGNGNVGIGGELNPTSTLDVNGEIEAIAIKGPSDIRYKKNIRPLNNSLEKVLALKGYNYEWRREEFPDKKFKIGNDIGLIAQEVEKIIPEVVYTDDNEMQSKSIDYAKLVPLLVEAIKEQEKEIQDLKRQLNVLKAK